MEDPFNRDLTAVHDRAEDIPASTQIRVRRLTCDNGSPMTFTGTQSYLIGTGDVAVIDPGPMNEGHLGRLLAALDPAEKISHIVVTHSHVDHSPGARWLADRTGAPVLAYGAHGAGMSPLMQGLPDLGGGEGGDKAFAPDRTVADGETIGGGDWSLTAIHTPGHLSNHLSFALGDTGVVFTGDTVMGWATTLVSPPEGDMAAFMASLAQLSTREDRLYLPGHGHPVEDPAAMLAYQTSHRKSRAEQVLRALEDGPSDTMALTMRIYTDVDPKLLPAARRNVLSTLIWMMEEGKVAADGAVSPDAVFRRV
ncbi:MBL fold metallo-hydrolase [Rhodobacteraceae bacterium NNCM2]|nr:MBL fold metallo-hydrolase [Coraliihabitans acroporae]